MLKLVKIVPLFVFTLVVGSVAVTPSARAQAPAAKPADAAPRSQATTKTATGTKASKAPTAADTAPAGVGGKTTSRTGVARPGDEKDVPATTPPPDSSPMADLKKSNEQLDKLLKKKHPAWSPEGEAQKAAVQKLVGGFLDYRELARRSLARHWDKLQPSQRQEFVTTLRELVERSYLKQVSGDPNYNIKYDKEAKNGSEATVDATLNTMARGKKVKIALVYKLVHKDRWLVYDVVTDEQSMLENYRAEFNKIINRDGFDALLTRMKRKLEEKDE